MLINNFHYALGQFHYYFYYTLLYSNCTCKFYTRIMYGIIGVTEV